MQADARPHSAYPASISITGQPKQVSYGTALCDAGTDIAIEAADYVLMSGNLQGVLTALDLSGTPTTRIIFV